MLSLVLIGLAGGALGGMLGVGGGLITVPALHLLRNESMQMAIGASLFSNAVVGASSAWRFNKQGRVSWPWVGRILAGTAVGGLAGVLIASRLSQHGLRMVFGGFMILAALDLFSKGKGAPSDEGTLPPPSWKAAPVVGVPTGLAAGLMGIGGGIVAVPFQRRFFRVPIKLAIGNSAATIPFTCILAGGAALKAFEGNRPSHVLAVSGLMALGGLSGALTSATLSRHVPGKTIRWIFGVFLLASALRMLS